jgi:hypothetical protein
MSRPELNEDFVDMLVALGHAGVEFVVVGAHALAAHGIVRATGDIDVLVRPSPDNAERVCRALVEFGAPLAIHGVEPADFAKPGNVYQIGLPPRRIDVLTSISGVSFDEAWASRVAVRLGEIPVFVLGREAMILNKRAAARPKDLLDADALERAPH